MKSLRILCAFLALASVNLVAQSNPLPILYQLSPPSITPNHSNINLSIQGTGFVPGAIVLWNNHPLITTFVSSSLLKAVVTGQPSPRSAAITVKNPKGNASNVIYFLVRLPSSHVSLGIDPSPIEPGVVTVADFNGDGAPDILVDGAYHESTYYIDTYLGDWEGGFSKVKGQRANFPAQVQWPNPVGDFNHDGILDVALSSGNEAPDVTSIYLSNGAGKFTGVPIRGVDGQGAVADLNGDGELDFVTNAFDGFFTYVNTYLESQDSYQLSGGATVGEGYLAGAPVIGDFNNDGKLDVVMTGKNIVRVFLGNGDGTLQPEVDYAVPSSHMVSAVADVNGDGNLDIVTNGACVLLGKGDGTFTNGSCGTLSFPWGDIFIGDFNGDGKLDIATLNSGQVDMLLSILLGNGDGTFQNPIAFDIGQAGKGWGNFNFGVADFNDDGKLDFAIAGVTSSVVLLQR